ncbi:hypothetical protein [Nocardia testacea]|uniref:hypothetical protein n=1 Tax=Nocardia testacea TaxID=248551 RepID=UPI003A89B4CB
MAGAASNLSKSMLESARRVEGACTDFCTLLSRRAHGLADTSGRASRWLPEVEGSAEKVLRYGDADNSIGGSAGNWRHLDADPDARYHTMDDAPGFLRRWNLWRAGEPDSRLHHVSAGDDGGIDSAEGASWVDTAEIVPGDRVSTDGGPPGEWTDGIDEEMRHIVTVVNREVGPTVSACAGHRPPSDSKRRLMRFVCADESQANEVVDKVVPAARKASTPDVTIEVRRGDVLSQSDDQRYPAVRVMFQRREGLSDEEYYSALGPMTEEFAARLKA